MGAVPSRESHEDPSSAFFVNCGNLVVLHIPLTRHFFPSARCQAFRQLRDARNNQSALYSFDVRHLDEWLPGAPAEAFRAAQARDHGEEVAEADPSVHYLDHEIEKAQDEEIAAQARARLAEGSSDQNPDDLQERSREEDRDGNREIGVAPSSWPSHAPAKDPADGSGHPSPPPRCSIESLTYLYDYLVADAAGDSASSSVTASAEADPMEAQFEREEAVWVRSPWSAHGVGLVETNKDMCEQHDEEMRWRANMEAWRRQKTGAATSCAPPPAHSRFMCPIPEALAVRLTPGEVQAAQRQFRLNQAEQQKQKQGASGNPVAHETSGAVRGDEDALCAAALAIWPAPIPPAHVLRRRYRFEVNADVYKDGRLHLVEEDGVLYYFAMNPAFVEPDLPVSTATTTTGETSSVNLRDFLVEPCTHTVIHYLSPDSLAGGPHGSGAGGKGRRKKRANQADDGEEEEEDNDLVNEAAAAGDGENDAQSDGGEEMIDERGARRARRLVGECERCGARVERSLDVSHSGIPLFPSALTSVDETTHSFSASGSNSSLVFSPSNTSARYLVPVTPVRVVGVHGTLPACARGSPWLRGLEDAPDLDAHLETQLPLANRPPVLRLCRFIEGAVGEKILNRATLVTLLTYRLLCQRAGLEDALVRPVWTNCTLSNIPFLQMVRETFFRARAAVAEIDDEDHTLRDWLEQFDVENNFMCFINRNLSTTRDYAPPERHLRGPASASTAGSSAASTTAGPSGSQSAQDGDGDDEGAAAASGGDIPSRETLANNNSNNNNNGGSPSPSGGSPLTSQGAPGPSTESTQAHANLGHHRSSENVVDADGEVSGEKGAIGRPEGHIPRDAEENGEDVYNEDDLSKLVAPPEKPTFRPFSSRLEPHAPVSIDTLFEHDIQQDKALPPEALPGYVQRDLLHANQRRQEQPRSDRRPSHALYEAGMRQSTRGRQLLFQLRADCVFALMYYCSQAAAPIFIGAYIEPVDTTPLSYGGAVRLVEPKPEYPATTTATTEFAQMEPLSDEIGKMVEDYFLEKELITVFSVSDSTTWARGPDAAHSLHKLLLPAAPNPDSALGQKQAEERRVHGHVLSYAVGDFRDADLVVYNSTLRCWEHYEHVQIRRRFNWTAQQQQLQHEKTHGEAGPRDETDWTSSHEEEGEDTSVPPLCGSPPTTLTQRQQLAIEAAGISAVAPQDPASMSARLLCVGLDELLLSWTKWVVDNRFYEDRHDPGWLRLNLNAPWPPIPIADTADGDGDAAHNAGSGSGVSVHTLVRRGRYFIWSFRHNEDRYFYGVIPKFAKDRLRRQKTHYRQRKKKAAAAAAAAAAAVGTATTAAEVRDGVDGTSGTLSKAAEREEETVRKTARTATPSGQPKKSATPSASEQRKKVESSARDAEETETGQPVAHAKGGVAAVAPSEPKKKRASVTTAQPEARPAALHRRVGSSGNAAGDAASLVAMSPQQQQQQQQQQKASQPQPQPPQQQSTAHADPYASSFAADATTTTTTTAQAAQVDSRARTRPSPLNYPSSAGHFVVSPNVPPTSYDGSSPLQPQQQQQQQPAHQRVASGSPSPVFLASSAPSGSGQWHQSPLASMTRPLLSSQQQQQQQQPQQYAPVSGTGVPYSPHQPQTSLGVRTASPTVPTPTMSGSAPHLMHASLGPHAYAPPTPTHVSFAAPPLAPVPPQQVQANLAYHRNGVNTFMQASKRHENEYYPPLPTNPQQRLFHRPVVPQQSVVSSVPVRGLAGPMRLAPGTPTATTLMAGSTNTSPPESGRSTPHVQVRVRTLKSGFHSASAAGYGSHPSTPVGSYSAVPFGNASPAGAPAYALPNGDGEEDEEDGRISPTSLLPPNLIQDGSKTKGESYLRTEANPDLKEMRSAFRWNPYSRHKKPQ